MEEVRARLDIMVLVISEGAPPAVFRDKVSALDRRMVGVVSSGLILRLATSLLRGRLASLSVILMNWRIPIVMSSVGISLDWNVIPACRRVDCYLGLGSSQRHIFGYRLC